MANEKKEVSLTLVRTLTHNLKAKLTKEEFEQLKKHVGYSNGEGGAEIINEMKNDSQREPDRWRDWVEELNSDWEED